MKAAVPILLAGLALACPEVAAEAVVRFANDDQLAGSLESLSSEALVWSSPALEKPVPFFLKNVIDLSLPGAVPETEADHVATVTLTNGDTVRGQLATVTDETVALDTSFAGRMDFNRLMVSGVKIESRSKFLYRGPDGLDGWAQSSAPPVWTYGSLAFRSDGAGSIARDGVLPDECAVTFDVAWKSDSIALKVVLFSDDPSSDNPGSGYELSFQRGSIYLRTGKTQGFLGSANSQALLEYDKVRLEIRASRKSGKVCLFVADRLVEVWSDPDVAKGSFGSALHFVSQNPMPMRISNIVVAPWDGVVDQVPEPRVGMIRRFDLQAPDDEPEPAAPEPPKKTRMVLANDDTMEGEVTAIKDGLISVTTPLGEIQLPVGRLRTITLKKVDLERCIRRNGDIRGWFPDGSSIVFRLDGVTDGSISGSSQNFGTATFRMDAFNRIEFNIYDVELEEKRASDDW